MDVSIKTFPSYCEDARARIKVMLDAITKFVGAMDRDAEIHRSAERLVFNLGPLRIFWRAVFDLRAEAVLEYGYHEYVGANVLEVVCGELPCERAEEFAEKGGFPTQVGRVVFDEILTKVGEILGEREGIRLVDGVVCARGQRLNAPTRVPAE